MSFPAVPLVFLIVGVVPTTMTFLAAPLVFLLLRVVVVPTTMAFLAASLVFILIGGAVVAPTMMVMMAAVVVPPLPPPLSLATATSFVPRGAVHVPVVVFTAVLLLPPPTTTAAVRRTIDAARSAPPGGRAALFAPAAAPAPSFPLSPGRISTATATATAEVVVVARTTVPAVALVVVTPRTMEGVRRRPRYPAEAVEFRSPPAPLVAVPPRRGSMVPPVPIVVVRFARIIEMDP